MSHGENPSLRSRMLEHVGHALRGEDGWCDVDSNVAFTAMNPSSSNAKSVDSFNHFAAPACVHQMHSSALISRPL